MQLFSPRAPALLAACFAWLGVALAGASLAQAPLAVEPLQPRPSPAPPFSEKGPTLIDAEHIEGVIGIEFTARGKAELRQDETAIFGETIKFNQEFGRIEADGGVRMEQGADRFFGPRLRYDTGNGTGVFEAPSFAIGGEQPGRGGAERIEFLGKDHFRLDGGWFTSCAPGRDDWRIEAATLDLDYGEKVGTVTNGRLRFLNTTIAVLPWMSFPLDRGRKTGFLAPSYTQSTRSGLEFSIPFYWNIAPELDATITPRYLSKRGTQLQTEFRYLDPKYSGTANVEYLAGDNLVHRNRYGLSLMHQHAFAPNLLGRLNLNRVSDDRYFVDLFSRVRQTSQGIIPREGYLQYGGAAFGLGYFSSLLVQRFQTLQDPLAPTVSPYERVPQINISTGKNDIAGLADLAMPLEYARFSHPTLVEGTRISMNPTLSVPFLTPGFFVTPRVGLRHASYNLHRTSATQPEKQTLSLPWFSLDTGMVFERDVRLAGYDLTQTLEPRAYYVNAPYRNQAQIPLFDTSVADFNYAQIFSENRFVGGDRFGDANQLTLAATSRLLLGGGGEFLRATLGQRFYFRPEQVALTPATPTRSYDSSDLLAAVSVRYARAWTFDTGMQYNRRLDRTERYSMNLRYAPEFAKFVNLGYRFTRDAVDQIDISGQWPIRPGWFAIGRYNYSFRDGRLLEGIGGLEYNAGCWVLRVIVHHQQLATQLASTEYFIQLELNDLAQIGSNPFDLLKRAVPGYQPTNIGTNQPIPTSLQRPFPFQQVY